ncbi:hypothetical protein QT381_03215 [Galbitalea sp. SE-J8]|uniref:hypothetical protein n=1 Tax=Galbitalea sp. SE-J8 TaxID=3054952 RepID=UPI00259D1016|nr:hypothetical protein [Galbitalea sp. SE-J8]MDM4762013.1 hypothetical protein [Galbitalea sp. SE-J8]
MEVTGVGSGVLLAIAAVLWLVYLVPTWLRRREFDATERNAVRLQQTLRVLAETAEVPDAVRAETTARDAALQARVLRAQERRRALEARAMAAAAIRDARVDARTTAGRRIRRSRAVTSLVMAASLLSLAATGIVIGVGGASIVTAWIVFVAVTALVSSLAMLRRLARVTRPDAVARPELRKHTSREAATLPDAVSAEPRRGREWTPAPVPKPLYMSRATIAAAPEPAYDRQRLAAAAAAAAERMRAAHVEPEVAPLPVRPAPEPVAAEPVARRAASRFAGMGRVDDGALGRRNIDEALRRRRAAG